MSSALNLAIYNRLAGVEVLTGAWLAAQQFLAATLAVDPDTLLPGIYKGNVNDSPVVKDSDGVQRPVITFRPSAGVPDHRIAHGLAVDNGIYDFEFWNWYHTPNAITDMAEAVELLIDRRFDGPALTLTSGDVVWADPFVSLNEIYDDQRNGWIGLVRYQFIERRN